MSELEDAVKGLATEFELELSRLERERDDLLRRVSESQVVGLELGEANAQLYMGLVEFLARLNQQDAGVEGEDVTLQHLLSADAPIRLANVQIGNFGVEVRTFIGGAELLRQLAEDDLAEYNMATNNAVAVSEIGEALESVQRSVEARPEIEAGAVGLQSEIDGLNERIAVLQEPANELNLTLGVRPDGAFVGKASPERQLTVARDVVTRFADDPVIDLSTSISPLEQARQTLAPEMESISAYESPEVRAAASRRREPEAPVEERVPLVPGAEAPDVVTSNTRYRALDAMRREAEERAVRLAEEARSAAGSLSYDEQVALFEEQQRAASVAQRAADEQRAIELAQEQRSVQARRPLDEQRAVSLAEQARRGVEMAALQGDVAPAAGRSVLPTAQPLTGATGVAPAPAPTTMPPTLAPVPAGMMGPPTAVQTPADLQRAQFMAATATAPPAVPSLTATHPLTGATGTAPTKTLAEMTALEYIEMLATQSGGGGTGGAPRLTAAEMRAANQTEVERLLAEQFGGFSFFLQKHRSDLQVGLTADGQVVAAGDPNATSVKNILDVIVDQGITAPTRVLGMLQNTEWWQKTDSRMREYDVVTADMSEAQKVEYLEPVLDLLRDEAQFLGFQLEPGRARSLAEQITRMGEETDSEFIRELLTSEQAFDAAAVTASGFAAARDEIVAMSKRYFTPIGEDDAAAFAEDIYVGTKTAEGVEQYFREMAAAKMPQLQNALNAGITPEQYFAPYKYEIERMLDRPNIDLYEEFGDVIQYIPDTGTAEARPMTLNEVRTYVRGLDEWQMSKQGKDSAAALAFAIGQSFGEVA